MGSVGCRNDVMNMTHTDDLEAEDRRIDSVIDPHRRSDLGISESWEWEAQGVGCEENFF